MDIFNLIIGLALFTFGSYYLHYIYKNSGKDKKYENIKYSLMYDDITIVGGVFVFVMI